MATAASFLAEVVPGSIIAKLATLVEEYKEYSLRKPVRSDIAHLKAALSAMDTVALAKLTDRGRERDEEEAKALRSQLRELAYDVEDTIDELIWRRDLPVDGGCGFAPIAKSVELWENRDLANQIGKLKARASELSRGCKVDGAAASLPVVPESPPHHREMLEDLIDPGLVGMDGPRDEVVGLLLRAEPGVAHLLKAVSIVGPGGLGKTTLAREVYNSIKSQFDCSAFVSVSRTHVAPKIIKGILAQIGEPMDGNSDDICPAINHTRGCLENKRYLIVLDDLWCTSSWEIIRAAFPEKNRGSRVIITTRIESVAQFCCSNWDDHVYVTSTLSDSRSKALFYRKVFGSEDRCPPELKQVSEKILKKCGGVPLAIVCMASLLAHSPSAMNINWETLENQNLVCSALQRSSSERPTEWILATSYHCLPHHLKYCLLYLSLFADEHNIRKERLVWRWIAEGFIYQKNRESLWQTGEAYFNELISRRLLEPVDINYDGTVKACRVHDMVLDLILRLSREENFCMATAGATRMSHEKIRRVTISNSKEDLYGLDLSHVRSLSFSRPLKHTALLKNLRVLEIRGCNKPMHTKENDLSYITKLHQLKYLGLCHMTIRNLPTEVGQLRILQTLDVRNTWVKKLPISFLKLKSLLHVHVDNVRLPDKIGNTQELCRLGQFDILQSPLGAVEGLGYLSNLRELLIRWSPDSACRDIDKYEETLVHSLGKLRLLQTLDIDGSNFNIGFLDDLSPPPHLRRIHVGGRCYLPGASKWMALHANLTHINVNMLEVRMKDLQLLGGIPMLCELHLSSKQVHTEWLIIQSDQFPSLKGFSLHCPWIYLTFEQLAMPKLLFLLLWTPVLTAETNGFSFGIENLLSLKKLRVRINGEGADYSRIKAAEMAIKEAADSHAKRPTLEITSHDSVWYMTEGKGLDATIDLECMSKEEAKRAWI